MNHVISSSISRKNTKRPEWLLFLQPMDFLDGHTRILPTPTIPGENCLSNHKFFCCDFSPPPVEYPPHLTNGGHMPNKVKPIPDGYHTVTPSLIVRDAAKAI